MQTGTKRPHIFFVTCEAHGPSLLESRWLCWYLHQQGTALCSKRGAADCFSKGLHKRLEMVEVQGSLWCPPYCTVLYTTLNSVLNFHHLESAENDCSEYFHPLFLNPLQPNDQYSGSQQCVEFESNFLTPIAVTANDLYSVCLVNVRVSLWSDNYSPSTTWTPPKARFRCQHFSTAHFS
jgi:hypothetical protein